MKNSLRREILNFDVDRYEKIAEGYFANSERDSALPNGVDLLYKDLTDAFQWAADREILVQLLLMHQSAQSCVLMHGQGIKPGMID